MMTKLIKNLHGLASDFIGKRRAFSEPVWEAPCQKGQCASRDRGKCNGKSCCSNMCKACTLPVGRSNGSTDWPVIAAPAVITPPSICLLSPQIYPPGNQQPFNGTCNVSYMKAKGPMRRPSLSPLLFISLFVNWSQALANV